MRFPARFSIFFLVGLLAVGLAFLFAAAPPVIDNTRQPGNVSTPAVIEAPIPAQPVYSKLVYPGPDGKLVYRPDPDGDFIPDFSRCGYAGGGVPLPVLPVKATVLPGNGVDDDRARIQAALDAVAKLPPDGHGFRGAVLLKRGHYRVGDSLVISASGVVLRGEGQGPDGTVLLATKRKAHTVIVVGDKGHPAPIPETRQPVVGARIPSGVKEVPVADASGFKAGDRVIVFRPGTAAWIHDLKMDVLRETYHNLRLINWNPAIYNIVQRRTVTAIRGNTLVLDAPIVQAIDAKYGGGWVCRYANPEQIEQAGVEDLRIDSVYDPALHGPIAGLDPVHAIRKYRDENHAWVGVMMKNVRDGWALRVTSLHTGYGNVHTELDSDFITVEGCEMYDPVSKDQGGRKYSYVANGQMGLFLHCYSRNSRHDFSFASRVTGPNAYVDCSADESGGTSEPHHRYAVGGLFDNVVLRGQGAFLAVNRGDSGSGHGWAGAQMVFWNCFGQGTFVMRPPDADNYSIGWAGPSDLATLGIRDRFAGMLDWIRRRSTKTFTYQGVPVMGDGWIESPTEPVTPRSLYFAQLSDRLGAAAVEKHRSDLDSALGFQSNFMPRLFSCALLFLFLAAVRVPAAPDLTAKPLPAGPDQITPGKFQPTWDSLDQGYQSPAWFRDAKFGIWAHWTAQAVPGQGDWYARNMYIQGTKQYDYQVKTYGHPTKFGFKDIDHLWTAAKWDPEALMKLYVQAGAHYFVALGNHHDNFDCWNSTYQPWNSVNVGPHQDIVGRWAATAREFHLPFGVSVHSARTWQWLQVAYGHDVTGPLRNVPYDGFLTKADGKGLWWDGLDPQDLYGGVHVPIPTTLDDIKVAQDWHDAHDRHPGANTSVPNDNGYSKKWYYRTKDLLDQYHPDLLYFDDTELPLGQTGLDIAADYYNANLKWHDGALNAVLNAKNIKPEHKNALVEDFERGQADRIEPYPWQTDTCIGDWHYSDEVFADHKYKTVAKVTQMLCDIVSKNGNLLLNIPLRGDGAIDSDEVAFLKGMAAWMGINGEGIFGTRPWLVYGEGPPQAAGKMSEKKLAYTAADIRFTTKGAHTLYAYFLDWPANGKLTIHTLNPGGPLKETIAKLVLLGSTSKITWTRDASGLHVMLPAHRIGEGASALRLTLQ